MRKFKQRTYRFKKKKIADDQDNAAEALLNLYAESERLSGETVEPTPEQPADSLGNILREERRRRRRRTLVLTILGILLCAAVAVAGFYYFNNRPNFVDETVVLDISGPEQIKIGEEITYVIHYENKGEVPLQESRIVAQYPTGFELLSSEPSGVNRTWSLGILAPRQSGDIKISGRLVAEPATEAKLSATLHFWPSNFNSEFVREATRSATLAAPDWALVSDVPANVSLGQKLTLRLKIKNFEEEAFDNLKLTITYPDRFNYLNAKPAPFTENNEWLISELAAGSENVWEIEGNFPLDMQFADEAAREQDFTARLYFSQDDKNYFLAKELTWSVKIIDQAIAVYLIGNGSTENKTIELGDRLVLSAVAKNSGAEKYDLVSLKTVIKSEPLDILDWSAIEDKQYGKISKTDAGKEIVWSKSQYPEFASFDQNEEAEMLVTLPVKTLDKFTDAEKTALAAAQVEVYAEFSFAPESGIPSIKSSSVILSVLTDLQLETKVYYYNDEGEALGAGPLPPVVGQETMAKVRWDLSNHLHEVKNVLVSAVLPDNVAYKGDGEVSVGELNFDEQTRTLTWSINRLPLVINSATADFPLSFTPRAEDNGKLLKLTGNVSLTALDESVASQIIKTGNILTTAMEGDKYAEGLGIVIK